MHRCQFHFFGFIIVVLWTTFGQWCWQWSYLCQDHSSMLQNHHHREIVWKCDPFPSVKTFDEARLTRVAFLKIDSGIFKSNSVFTIWNSLLWTNLFVSAERFPGPISVKFYFQIRLVFFLKPKTLSISCKRFFHPFIPFLIW